MKLEIKHIAPYLPYELYCFAQGHNDEQDKPISERILGLYDNKEVSITLCDDDSDIYYIDDIFPILRPLSDLFNGNYENILDEFSISSLDMFETAFLLEIRSLNAFDFVNYTTVLLLLENHFDIYGLIENGLAININTLDK